MEFANEADIDPRDLPLAKEILTVLHMFYPRFAWVVEAPPGQGLIHVRNLDCDPRGKYGFVFHKENLSYSNLTRTVIRAGGEFLERWNIERRGMREEDFANRPKIIFERPDG